MTEDIYQQHHVALIHARVMGKLQLLKPAIQQGSTNVMKLYH